MATVPAATARDQTPVILQQQSTEDTVKLSFQDRVLAILTKYFAPRTEVIFASALLCIGFLLVLRGTLLASIVGFMLMLAGVLFLFVIVTYNKSTITKAEAKEFLEAYYSHPMDASQKPNVEYMSIRDVLNHVSRCIEVVPDKRVEFAKKYQKKVVEDWEGPVREWVMKYYNKAPETKKDK